MGEGYNSPDDFVPGFMYKAGFKKINGRLRDKATSFIPPYSSPEEQSYHSAGGHVFYLISTYKE